VVRATCANPEKVYGILNAIDENVLEFFSQDTGRAIFFHGPTLAQCNVSMSHSMSQHWAKSIRK
jgi:hypothetical protein